MVFPVPPFPDSAMEKGLTLPHSSLICSDRAAADLMIPTDTAVSPAWMPQVGVMTDCRKNRSGGQNSVTCSLISKNRR